MWLLLLLSAPVQTSSSAMVTAEFRPVPRLGAVIEHHFSDALGARHALTIGFGSFPDFEIRSALLWSAIDPFYPWIAVRGRAVHLEELPPLELFGTIGLGFRTDPTARIGASAGLGLRLQLPPLAPEPAGDRGTYLAEDVAAEAFVALTVSLW